MIHKDSWWSRRWIGTLELELANGRKLEANAYREGKSYWLGKGDVHGRGSIEEAVHEFGVVNDSPVKNWRWSVIR